MEQQFEVVQGQATSMTLKKLSYHLSYKQKPIKNLIFLKCNQFNNSFPRWGIGFVKPGHDSSNCKPQLF